MTLEQISEKVYPILEKYMPEDINIQNITPEKDLIKDLKINSAYLIDIIISIEETFEITLSDEDISKMNTVGEALGLIHEKLIQ
jgi:acyl carrier protein